MQPSGSADEHSGAAMQNAAPGKTEGGHVGNWGGAAQASGVKTGAIGPSTSPRADESPTAQSMRLAQACGAASHFGRRHCRLITFGRNDPFWPVHVWYALLRACRTRPTTAAQRAHAELSPQRTFFECRPRRSVWCAAAEGAKNVRIYRVLSV